MRRKALWAANAYWDSPFQVGAHHLAGELVKRGWDVAFVSEPVSPWHWLGASGVTVKDRWGDWRRGGGRALGGHLFHYSPLTLLPPQNKPLLRSPRVLDAWDHLTFPNAGRKLREEGFGEVDLLVVDTATQHVWTRLVGARKTLFRVTDRFSAFKKATPSLLEKERDLARRADLVVFTAQDLKADVEALGPKRSMFLPNGVDLAFFKGSTSLPSEYRGIPSPRAVYVGALDDWFAVEWVLEAARRLPKVSFVIIGPPGASVAPLRGVPNIHLLGPRRRELLPGYLRHAQVGLIPFDVERHGDLLHGVNPMKLYEYMACGLPVVSSRWRELERLKSPAYLSRDKEGFARDLQKALRAKRPGSRERAFASRHDWGGRAERLLQGLGFPSGHRVSENREKNVSLS